MQKRICVRSHALDFLLRDVMLSKHLSYQVKHSNGDAISSLASLFDGYLNLNAYTRYENAFKTFLF